MRRDKQVGDDGDTVQFLFIWISLALALILYFHKEWI